jgi:hypothetical protein
VDIDHLCTHVKALRIQNQKLAEQYILLAAGRLCGNLTGEAVIRAYEEYGYTLEKLELCIQDIISLALRIEEGTTVGRE